MDNTIIKCYCSNCKKQTNHIIEAEVKDSYHDDDYEIFIDDTYRIVKCCGCDNISFNRERTGSEYMRMTPEGYEESYSEYDSYPEKEGSITPISSWDIPSIISRVYTESILAFNENCYILATTGLRTTVEAICRDKGITGGNLKHKIDGLLSEGIITAHDARRLHEMRFSGNDSAHQMQPLEKDELLLLIEIINNMLNNLYILDKKFNDTFFYRFESEDAFFALLDKGIERFSVGSSYVLNCLLPDNFKYRKEDILRLETVLINKIQDGSYTHLELDGTPNEGQRQKFKVIGR